jgi:predicted MFS family arabinose efflux permease
MSGQRLDRRLVVLLAFACGAAVANLYYAQPLLDVIARDLHVSEGAAGLIVTASQVGYAAGLVFLVPLGDLVARRVLVFRTLLVCALALAGCALAPSLGALAAAVAVVGVTSVVAQVLVPFAGDLAGDEERGAVVGIVMSGLLIGILSARTASGLLAGLLGWRGVYAVGAGLMLVLAAALRGALPGEGERPAVSYRQTLRSVLTLVRTEPVLRLRMAYGALGMTSFTVLWTALTFLLAGPAFGYTEATIGLFGLAGLAGAFAAQGAGRLFDRGLARPATGLFWLVIGAGWGACALGSSTVVPLLVGILLIDAGVQGQHITNQSTIYALDAAARSRLTTAYMTGNFTAAALGSALASAAWAAGGWGLVTAIGAACAVLALLVWVAEGRLLPVAEPEREREAVPTP